ncbi:hypothetical protein QTN25_000298 [Entamoeba marina]
MFQHVINNDDCDFSFKRNSKHKLHNNDHHNLDGVEERKVYQVYYLIGLLNQYCSVSLDIFNNPTHGIDYPKIKQIHIDEDVIDFEEFTNQQIRPFQMSLETNKLPIEEIEIQLFQKNLCIENNYMIDMASMFGFDVEIVDGNDSIQFDYIQEVMTELCYVEFEEDVVDKGMMIYNILKGSSHVDLHKENETITKIISC